jgi:hypothetical protein
MEGELAQSPGVTVLGFIFILTMCVLTWSLPRRNALLPLLVTTCYMPLGQEFVIFGLHFQFLRVLLLLGALRIYSRGEAQGGTLTTIDRVFMWWCVATVIMGTLAEPSFERFINRSGDVFNAVGIYLLFRCWIRSTEEVMYVARCLSIMILPMAASMVLEKFTSRNLFAVFGGVPEVTLEREGRLRCQGAFRHPILAGTYAATIFPLCIGLWFQGGRDKKLGVIGAIGATVATVAAASSGAFLTLLTEVIGFALWPIRYHMRWLRRGSVITLIALGLVMKAPVWYLIARISDIAGGTGWHRAYLIDQAVNHFGEWWFTGTTYTAHWAPSGQVLEVNPNMMDITNQYIMEGVSGGILKLGLFITLIVRGFRLVGQTMRRYDEIESPQRFFIWSLGVCLFGHCVSFLSISYFDQIVVMWYWLLANLSMLAIENVVASNEKTLVEEPVPAS